MRKLKTWLNEINNANGTVLISHWKQRTWNVLSTQKCIATGILNLEARCIEPKKSFLG